LIEYGWRSKKVDEILLIVILRTDKANVLSHAEFAVDVDECGFSNRSVATVDNVADSWSPITIDQFNIFFAGSLLSLRQVDRDVVNFADTCDWYTVIDERNRSVLAVGDGPTSSQLAGVPVRRNLAEPVDAGTLQRGGGVEALGDGVVRFS
jgi:hypothetical protein